MKKILVTVPFNEEQKNCLQKKAENSGVPCRIIFKSRETVAETDLKDVQAVIGNLPIHILRKASALEWVQLNSAGANPYADPGKLVPTVMITTASGAYGLAVSEHMLAQTFALFRRFDQYGDCQRKHQWRAMGKIHSVEGSVIAVLGMGDIGREYARKVKALGASVIGVRMHEKPKPEYLDEQILFDQLDEILPCADLLAMILPATAETDDLMNRKRIGLMKQGSFLINCGRGNSLDYQALQENLESGHLSGAAIDVAPEEPLPSDSPLWNTDHLIITPHVAGGFYLPETLNRIACIAGDNLEAWLKGDKMRNTVPRG